MDVNGSGKMLNNHAVGIIMKELVRRAVVAIRNQRQIFEVKAKQGYGGQMDDMVTSADKIAQEVYVRSICECFPGWGIIGEEDALIVPCTDGSGLFFTVDPLDGTKAFVRRQSHGIGTMISLSNDQGEFVAAYVGDINTEEIYGFRPGSEKVHRITEFNNNEHLHITTKPLTTQYILLREPERKYSELSQNTILSGFRNQIVDGGSIGIWLARLWKGEVGAALLAPSWETPWDSNPVTAITKKLGFIYLRPSPMGGTAWIPFHHGPLKEKFQRNYDVLIIHRDNAGELEISR